MISLSIFNYISLAKIPSKVGELNSTQLNSNLTAECSGFGPSGLAVLDVKTPYKTILTDVVAIFSRMLLFIVFASG
jgi:hypothetical protein